MKESRNEADIPPVGQMAGRSSPGASGDWIPGYNPRLARSPSSPYAQT